MPTHIYTPYTYIIRCVPTGQVYYGVRYAKGCHPSDLWNTYFTSSKYVRALREEHGDDAFVYEVRRTFDNKRDAIRWEEKVLRRIKFKETLDKWINRNVRGSIFLTEEEIAAKAKKQGETMKRLYAEGKLKPWCIGKKMTEEQKKNFGGPCPAKRKPKPKDHGRKVSSALKGKPKAKTRCVHCKEMKGKALIERHEYTCWANPNNAKVCEGCNKSFYSPNYKKRYCSTNCSKPVVSKAVSESNKRRALSV